MSGKEQEYIKKEVGDFYKQFHVENASPLIQLIESGDFINNIEKTENTIKNFIRIRYKKKKMIIPRFFNIIFNN